MICGNGQIALRAVRMAKVVVGYEANDGNLKLTASDNGIGLPKEIGLGWLRHSPNSSMLK
jgi:hypothetical protein